MKPAEMQQPTKPGKTRATGSSVTDPVCGMVIDRGSAAGTFDYEGETYYFCSTNCLNKFRAEPERYLQSQTTASLDIQRTKPTPPPAAEYTCPMHPEVRQNKPRSCPKCGMALERDAPQTAAKKIEYTCPMHPQIVRDKPGNCPICGMALEPRTVTLAEEENYELKDMRRRFWVSVVLTIPVFVLGMSDLIPGAPLQRLVPPAVLPWLQLILASPVVLWGGWPFFVRAWQSVVNRSLNMFTLIGLGVGVAYGYSVVATLLPDI
ncbi:MAG: YHS domain-containing protein, partial [Acidobacteria bacterium]|nr:YHS domain-containing protein [Acidobacteriota bacterium]